MPIADAQSLLNHQMGLAPESPAPIEGISLSDLLAAPVDSETEFAFTMFQNIAAQLRDITPEELLAQSLDEDIGAAPAGVADPKASYRIFSRKNQTLYIAKEADSRPFANANANGEVSDFELSPDVIHTLFGSMPHKDFLRNFIQIYEIPRLHVERKTVCALIKGQSCEVGVQAVYFHRDPRGFEITYHAKSVILDDSARPFVQTPPDGSLTIRQIPPPDH